MNYSRPVEVIAASDRGDAAANPALNCRSVEKCVGVTVESFPFSRRRPWLNQKVSAPVF